MNWEKVRSGFCKYFKDAAGSITELISILTPRKLLFLAWYNLQSVMRLIEQALLLLKALFDVVIIVVTTFFGTLSRLYSGTKAITSPTDRQKYVNRALITGINERMIGGAVANCWQLRTPAVIKKKQTNTKSVAKSLLRVWRSLRNFQSVVVLMSLMNLIATLWWLFISYGPVVTSL